MEINNWTNLISKVSVETRNIFKNLLNDINVFLNSCKFDKDFNSDQIKSNHKQKYDYFKTLYEQLVIEPDVTQYSTKIPYLNARGEVIINMTSAGKWIQFHTRDAKINFVDEEKTILDDKPLSIFLNKMDELISEYKYFGKKPMVYYKFKNLPDSDIVEYMKSFDVIAIQYNQTTPPYDYPSTFSQKLLLDQAIILTICSNLSSGLSTSYYQITKENINPQMVLENKKEIDDYLRDKELLVTESVYQQSLTKMKFTAGEQENKRFEELLEIIKIVPDCKNERFVKMKTRDNELICISVAEREGATIVTNNKHVYKKIELYHNEIPCKLFMSVQLTETKYA
ncbi:hypothetical protein ma259 [Moumouvirus australiensis]|uniref:DUF1308 domain-containing protein n=1 Tax=Moumouvirus australiensis TaxID=2109587 RepID=A0A2P1EL97_9VIRU|nr:hypothetical protein QKC55_gp645 [Moumouvirus australiensis]AVL94645.1 hypothetical protein ma259 [Moumouvirus australiensis]